MMLIACTNKGCLKTSNALFDEDTKEVICQECGKDIYNISDAMKRTLKSFGQIVKSNERKAFTMSCRNCRANREVALNEYDETVCKICHDPINITVAFRLAMEETGTKLARIETKSVVDLEEEVAEPAKKKVVKRKQKANS